MSPDPTPSGPAPAGGAFCLTVDVEEWYHTCLVPAYIDPARRPYGLVEELDHLLPDLLELFAEAGVTATFFVLGEVAERLPGRIREIRAAGHEVASHCFLHFRAGDLELREFARQARASKLLLEEITGDRVTAFRAPEWSLREPANPRLVALVEAGYEVDSSLAPFLGAGRWSNPRRPYRLEATCGDGSVRSLLELPPLTFGGPLRLPAGSWTGRLARPERLLRAARREADTGGLPVFVVHPWELAERALPGPLRGFARFVHETGRAGYRRRFSEILRGASWRSIREVTRERPASSIERRYTLALGQSTAAAPAELATASRAR